MLDSGHCPFGFSIVNLKNNKKDCWHGNTNLFNIKMYNKNRVKSNNKNIQNWEVTFKIPLKFILPAKQFKIK